MHTFTHAQHLGLYTAFHRSHANRLLHIGTLGGVFFSAMCLFALVPFGALPLAHFGTVLMVLLSLTMLRLHAGASALMLAVGLTGCALAGLLAAHVPAGVLAPAAVVLHLGSWWVSVKVAHERVEPFVQTPTGLVSSNLYFARGYYLGRNLGVVLTPFDRWIQFCISALSTAWDLAGLVGWSNPDEAEIAVIRERVLTRIAADEVPFAELAAQAPSSSVSASTLVPSR